MATEKSQSSLDINTDSDSVDSFSTSNRNRSVCSAFWYISRGCFLGHTPLLWSILQKHSDSVLCSPFLFIDMLFRAVGNLIFSNNPWSGLTIIIAMLFVTPVSAVLGLVGVTAGILTSFLIAVPLPMIRSGGFTFNCLLFGICMGLMSGPNVLVNHPDILLFAAFGASLIVFVWYAIHGMLSKFDFPVINAPFNLVMLLTIYGGWLDRYIEVPEAPSPTLRESLEHPLLDVNKFILGPLFAPNQICGVNTLETSILFFLAALLYSPLFVMQLLTGAGIGNVIGWLLISPDSGYETLYDGTWAYNPMLTSAAVGGYFLVFNWQSWTLAFVGSILTTMLFAVFVKISFPPLGIPFLLVTWLFIAPAKTFQEEIRTGFTGLWGGLRKVPLSQITTPELNRRSSQTNLKYTKDDSSPSLNSVLPVP